MALWQFLEEEGEWVQAQRPYLKWAGVWTSCKNVYVKVAGVWTKVYSYDTTPPPPPGLSLELYVDLDGHGDVKTRYIRVRPRMGSTSHDPSISQIRVLAAYNDKAPTSPFGQTYIAGPDSNYPGEPWSEWRYGPGFPHHDTSNDNQIKQFPLNAGPNTVLKGDKDYFFGAWACDQNGNWSAATQHHLKIEKGQTQAPTNKEVSLLPNHSGSWKKNVWEEGHLLQQQTPRSNGLFLYGGQFRDNGLNENSQIITAQIGLYRTLAGPNQNANVFLFWHKYGTIPALPAAGTAITVYQVEKVGVIAKGQTAWFNIPEKHYGDMKSGAAKGFGLYYKVDTGPGNANDNDFSQIASHTVANVHSGEIHLVWKQ